MKFIFLCICFFMPLCMLSKTSPRIHENFDFNWKFFLGDVIEAKSITFDDSNWENIQLPHDWSIGLPAEEKNGTGMGFLPGGIGWYRKTFKIPENNLGKKVVIQFDGIYHQSDVYINGQHLGFHPYGYTSFEYNLTPYLNYEQENIIAVRVDHSNCPSSRWYSGSGIYRHTWLKVTNPIQIATWGTFITTPEISDDSARVNIEVTINNGFFQDTNIRVSNKIIDSKGKEVSHSKNSIIIRNGQQLIDSQSLSVLNPHRWSIDDPYLYSLETTLEKNDVIIDRYTTKFGIRDIRFDSKRGFFLNGENIKMKGMNLHSDAGSLGTAVPDKSYLRRLRILKEYGVNAIRCSHNPPAPEFLDICDSLGFVVIDEAFDKWKSGYYKQYFDEWWRKDLEAMVLRDRNHPSIVLWSIGNETSEQNLDSEEGTERAKMLRDYLHILDPSRLVTAALRPVNSLPRQYNKNGFAQVLDVVGYNYQEQWLAEEKEQFSDRIMYVAEAYPYFRGKDDLYKAFYPINPWYDVANNDFIFGQFIWAGVDYIGESSGWPSTGWVTSPFDVCMFEKPSATFHRAVWNEAPIVRIAVADQSLDLDPGKLHWSWPFLASHWDFPAYEGRVICVHTTSNCESVELKLNGESYGKRDVVDYPNNTIQWFVPYAKGKVEAIGFNGDMIVTNHELNTPGAVAKVSLESDILQIDADGQSLAHVTIHLLDENGILVPNEGKLIVVEVKGEGRLLGLDNGDLRRKTHSGNTIYSYFGKALATIQSNRKEGNIEMTVKIEGLPDEKIIITTISQR